MNQKGALGLSINILVIIIISLVILGAGVAFLYNFVGGAEKIKAELDVRTEAELERLLTDQGKKVALARNTVTLNSGDNHVFGLGILNLNAQEYGKEFSISVTHSKSADEQDQKLIYDASSWLLYNTETIKIMENDHHTEPILVSVPKDAPKGTHIFNVEVTSLSTQTQYDNTKKISVKVK